MRVRPLPPPRADPVREGEFREEMMISTDGSKAEELEESGELHAAAALPGFLWFPRVIAICVIDGAAGAFNGRTSNPDSIPTFAEG